MKNKMVSALFVNLIGWDQPGKKMMKEKMKISAGKNSEL
jgi:hypothetical protein